MLSKRSILAYIRFDAVCSVNFQLTTLPSPLIAAPTHPPTEKFTNCIGNFCFSWLSSLLLLLLSLQVCSISRVAHFGQAHFGCVCVCVCITLYMYHYITHHFLLSLYFLFVVYSFWYSVCAKCACIRYPYTHINNSLDAKRGSLI